MPHDITYLDPNNAKEIEQVASMHGRFLNDSVVVAFGNCFSQRFYYKRLIEIGLLNTFCFKYEGNIVGFISYTYKPDSFLNEIIKKELFLFLYCILLDCLRQPSLLIKIFDNYLRFKKCRIAAGGGFKADAEILTLAVLPEYRSYEFFKKSGLKISQLLYQRCILDFKQRGVRNYKAYVEKDNFLINAFYRNAGMHTEGIDSDKFSYMCYIKELENAS